MAGWDAYADIAYEGGSFRLHAGLGWAAQLALEAARRAAMSRRTRRFSPRRAPCR